MKDEKYVVFKAQEFSDWYQTVDSYGDTVPMSLDDARVIRLHDVFAEAGCSAYAMNIQTVLDLVDPKQLKEDELEGMVAARDWFLQAAHDAHSHRQRGAAKFPD